MSRQLCDGYVTLRGQGSSDNTYTALKHLITSVSGRTLRVSSNVADTLVVLLAPALSLRDAEQRVAHF